MHTLVWWCYRLLKGLNHRLNGLDQCLNGRTSTKLGKAWWKNSLLSCRPTLPMSLMLSFMKWPTLMTLSLCLRVIVVGRMLKAPLKSSVLHLSVIISKTEVCSNGGLQKKFDKLTLQPILVTGLTYCRTYYLWLHGSQDRLIMCWW